MKFLGNIIWLLLGGLAISLCWALIGIILCFTIVGIPLGAQAFKMAELTLSPFGHSVTYQGRFGSALANLLWLVLGGWWLALSYFVAGLINLATIVGIPFGIQSFKMAKLALMPFGAVIR